MNTNLDNDDELIGRILTRRQILALIGGSGAIALAACAPRSSQVTRTSVPAASTNAAAPTAGAAIAATSASATNAAAVPSCVVSPEITEGPLFVEVKLNRSDIRGNTAEAKNDAGVVKAGIPLDLSFVVSRVGNGACAAYQGVYIDVWHCDALGDYSAIDNTMGINTPGQHFVRGYQVTDAQGKVSFKTIYPGWYSSRAVHIHVKLRTSLDSNKTGVFNSQLFFDDAQTTQVHTNNAPYKTKGMRDTLNSADSIYQNGGSQMQLSLAGSDTAGYSAVLQIGVSDL